MEKKKTINEFKTVLKTLREKRGLSQEKLGKELGISKGAICYYETGQRAPDIVVLSAFADYFEVSTDYLLGRTERKLNDKKGEFVNEVLDKQIRLLSETSEVCAANSDLFQELPKMTQALNAVIAAKDIHNGRTSYTYGFGCADID